MQPHQQRVVDEKTALSDKVDKLESFLGSSLYASLHPSEQSRLTRQHLIMQLYEQVLSERIANFDSEPPSNPEKQKTPPPWAPLPPVLTGGGNPPTNG